MIYNPLNQAITREIRLPLYYTGLTRSAYISQENGRKISHNLDANSDVVISVNIPAQGRTWLTISQDA